MKLKVYIDNLLPITLIKDGDDVFHLFFECVLCGMMTRDTSGIIVDGGAYVDKFCLERFETRESHGNE